MQWKILSAIAEKTQNGVIVTDAQGSIIWVNKSFESSTGYRLSEVLGRKPKDFLQGDVTDRAKINRMAESLARHEEIDIVVENVNKAGELFYNRLEITPIFDENHVLTNFFALQKDVTEDFLRNESNLNEKIFVNEILNNIPADIAVFNSAHQYIYVNEHAIRNPDIRSWIIGKTDFDYVEYRRLDPVLANNRRFYYNRAITTRNTVEWIDNHFMNGEKKHILRRFRPIFRDETLQFMIGYGIDVTELKNMELQVQELLVQQEYANQELENYAYVVSHDLQEPLRMIKTFTEILQLEMEGKSDDKVRKYFKYISDGADRMGNLIRDLLELSRIGRVMNPIEVVDCNELLDVLKMYFMDRKDNISLTFETLPSITCYKTLLLQLLQNLVTNSVKYNKSSVPSVSIGYTEEQEFHMFHVTDNGIGIDKKFAEKVFVIFQRLHSREEYSGTGIGLAICKKIVQLHGGRIWFDSVPGEGTTFHFTISKNLKP